MVLAELLKTAGVGGGIVMVVSAGIALYHRRSLMQVLAMMGTWVRVGGFFAFPGVLAVSGVIPGVDIALDFSALAGLFGTVREMVPLGTV